MPSPKKPHPAGAAPPAIAPSKTSHLFAPRKANDRTPVTREAIEAVGDDVPWVLQDYPLTLNVVMSAGVVAKIISNHPSCLMLKHEDWPGLEKISRLRAMQKAGDLRPFSILCGNGGMLFGAFLSGLCDREQTRAI